ncbi:MAG: site-2 protease family protein [Methanocorpusculum sp.]|nr:site-2 protease family protein [Methanocorpusculum sp.]
MEFGWLIPVIIAVMIYAVLYYWIKRYKILPNVFDFMGPCLMIKTNHTGIFDKLSRPKKLLIAYANVGIILTVICAVLITIVFILTAYLTMLVHPEPTAPQNLLLIPGVNEYVPSTFAVWFAIVFAMVIHECGHGILSRAEKIKVKSTGILALVIPIGAFVEPDEEDVENSPLKTKLRMFAAGITNNLFAGVVGVVILILLTGLIIPGASPYVYGVYNGYSAQEAGIQPGTVIYTLNDVPVYSLDDISKILSQTKAGDTLSLTGSYKGTPVSYDVTLSSIPLNISGSIIQSGEDAGFIGISFSEPSQIVSALNTVTHPTSVSGAVSSFLTFIILPFSSMTGFDLFSFLVVDNPNPEILSAPFTGFWEIIHILYWCSWLNILLGIFNALPIGFFDGGQMLRETLRAWFKKHGRDERRALQICSVVTYVLVLALIIPIVMPYFF